jgi:putative Mg2+ transporter-C (MgtC) family protein
MEYVLNLIGRLVLACILGGAIGYEREHTNRPAGFRTHILVCVGSALIMITSEFIFERYAFRTNMDPARLGAQIVSGIGFLGAGTIIREGFNVKGLTTAASLWAVSAVGIAAGIGFYEGALAATVLIIITLIALKRMEEHFAKKNRYKTLIIQSSNMQGQIGTISNIINKRNAVIKSMEFMNNEEDDNLLIKLVIKLPRGVETSSIINDLQNSSGIKKVYEE